MLMQKLSVQNNTNMSMHMLMVVLCALADECFFVLQASQGLQACRVPQVSKVPLLLRMSYLAWRTGCRQVNMMCMRCTSNSGFPACRQYRPFRPHRQYR